MKIKEFQWGRITFPLGTVIISNYYLIWVSYWKVSPIYSLNKMPYLTEGRNAGQMPQRVLNLAAAEKIIYNLQNKDCKLNCICITHWFSNMPKLIPNATSLFPLHKLDTLQSWYGFCHSSMEQSHILNILQYISLVKQDFRFNLSWGKY